MATRNYAKGQHTWYRRSDRFLWLRTDVSSSSSAAAEGGDSRWDRITQDIDYWSKVDRHEYDLAIKAQVLDPL